MRHLQDLHIESFRGIRDVKLEGIGQVNLLVGGNNSGKTSVLEAIDVHCHPLDILRFVTVSRKRDSDSVQMPVLESLRWMFPVVRAENGNKMGDIRISSRDQSGVLTTEIHCETTRVIEFTSEHGIYSRMSDEIYFKLDELEKELLVNDYEVERASDEWYEALGTDREEELRIVKESLQEKSYQLRRARDLLRDEYVLLKKRANEGMGPADGFDIRMRHISVDSSVIHEFPVTVTNKSSIKQGDPHVAPIPSQLVTPIDHRSLPINSKAITGTVLTWEEDRVPELLRLFDPEIEDVLLLAPDMNIPIPFVTHKKLGRVPSSIFGDGVRRALILAAAVVNAKDGVLLIDEIETAVHVKALDKVFKWLVKACKLYNVQLFATTHSLEAIDAILSSFLDLEEDLDQDLVDDLVTYRLVPQVDQIIVKRFSGESLYDIRFELGQDVR